MSVEKFKERTPHGVGAGIAPDAKLSYPVDRTPMGLPQGRSLTGQVIALGVWPLLEQFLSLMVGLVDTYLSGHLTGAQAMAIDAVGGAVYVMWLVKLLHAAVDTGATAIISRAIGAGDRDQANRALGQAMFMSMCWGLVTGVGLYVGASALGQFIHLDGPRLEMYQMYMAILAISTPFQSISFTGAAALRASGNTRAGFMVMVVINVVNTSLSWLLVNGPDGVGGHGLAGIAIGTVCAMVAGSIVVLVTLLKGTRHLKLHPANLRPQLGFIKRLVRLGLPNLLESLSIWGGNFILVGWVGRLGENAIGAHMVTIQIESISFLPGWAAGIAAMTLCGQYLGAGMPEMARRAVWVCWWFGTGFMTVFGLIFVLIPEVFVHYMTDKPAILEQAPYLLFIAGWVQPNFASYLVFSSAIRGAGDTRTAMFMSLTLIFAVRLPLAYLFSTVMDLGLVGIWYGLCAELFVRGLVFMGRFVHGGWMKVRV